MCLGPFTGVPSTSRSRVFVPVGALDKDLVDPVHHHRLFLLGGRAYSQHFLFPYAAITHTPSAGIRDSELAARNPEVGCSAEKPLGLRRSRSLTSGLFSDGALLGEGIGQPRHRALTRRNSMGSWKSSESMHRDTSRGRFSLAQPIMHSARHGNKDARTVLTGLAGSEVLERTLSSSPEQDSVGSTSIPASDLGNCGGGGRRGVAPGGGSSGGCGDMDAVEAQYLKMLEADPGHPLLLRNYATFLHHLKGNPFRAEPYFQRAILANPSDGEVLGLYAQLIWEVYHDEERACTYFDQALEACPDDCHLNAAYAAFLWSCESNNDTEGSDGCLAY